MSGLEPIAALSLACNILQLVELGRQTIGCIKTVYQGGKLDETLDQNSVILERLTNDVKKHRKSQTGKQEYEDSLLRAAASCSDAAQKVREEVRFLFGNAKKGSLVSAVKVTANSAWKRKRLERLEQDLHNAEKLMQTCLLAQVWRELRFFIEQYRQGHRETSDLVSWESLKTREHVTRKAERTNKAVALVDDKVDDLVAVGRAQVDSQERKHFLQSLKYAGFNERRNQVRNAYEDSLKWVFLGDHDDDSDGFQKHISRIKWDSLSNWLSSDQTVYWISGKPGSGKTTLVKYILADERTKKYLNKWSPGCEIASHFFWRPGSPTQKSLEGMLCSLLYQLLDNSDAALTGVMHSVPGPKDSHTDWSSAELRSALLRTLNTYKNGVCLFLDGLDEIVPGDGTKDGISEFLALTKELLHGRKVKLCLASRPDPYILEMCLSSFPRLRLQDLNYEDLMTYAKGHIDPEKFSATYQPRDPKDPIHSLVDKAEGVFLWLVLATKNINEGIMNDDESLTLQGRVESLPEDLDRLYQDMWARAGVKSPLDYRQTAAQYFKLLIASRSSDFDQRFSVFDLMLATTNVADGVLHALDEASKPFCQDTMLQKCRQVEKKLNIYCSGLVEKGPESQIDEHGMADYSWYGHMYDSIYPIANGSNLQFIHRTASDFLTDTESGGKILGFDTSSDFTVNCRVMSAHLARHALFAGTGSDIGWIDELVRIRETWKTQIRATSVAETLSLFVSKGARLDDSVNVAIYEADYFGYLMNEVSDSWIEGELFASMPAFNIITSLIEALRKSSLQIDDGTFKEPFQSLEQVCMSHHSSGKIYHVFGKCKRVNDNDGNISDPRGHVLSEITGEVQAQFESRLMELVKRRLVLSISALERDNGPKVKDPEGDEILWSMFNNESWTVKATGQSAICERLEELGLITRVDGTVDGRPIAEWVRMHNEKSTTSDADMIQDMVIQ
ncbi:hypothetical protein Daus18300_006186 [Diaporthe australafricana]|uniref:NACHT domain-containing protein n=1 Tax=Diaporthe australafricana TaxID=127596 RepID=A0ABR3WWU9_9PEZI